MKHLGDITQIRGSGIDAVSEKKIILDLCGGSGSWSRPYVEGGYDVRNITLPDYDVLTYDPPKKVDKANETRETLALSARMAVATGLSYGRPELLAKQQKKDLRAFLEGMK